MSSHINPGGEIGGYPIRVAARLAGVPVATVRAWERRYGAVSPARTETARRRYSEEDIERLRLISRLVAAGYSVGAVASRSTAQLRSLGGETVSVPEVADASATREPSVNERLVAACLDATSLMDVSRLQSMLTEAMQVAGAPALFDGIVASVMREVGERWERGTLSVAHEHVASAAVRQALGWLHSVFGAIRGDTPGPGLVATTLPGELHELGALMAAVTAASGGWRTTYLGPNSPVTDIATAAEAARASVVAVGITGQLHAAVAMRDLRSLRRRLPDHVTIVVGGRSAGRLTIQDIDGGIVRFASMRNFSAWLARQRPAAA
jgi:MerR family transcriptional regulator, light-induced transcriptional regulator